MSRGRALLLASAVLLVIFLVVEVAPLVTHATRPMWEPGRRVSTIPNFGSRGCALYTPYFERRARDAESAFPAALSVSRPPASATAQLHAPAPDEPKIIDTLLYNGEADMLRLRVFEIAPVVDTILIIEGSYTFSAKRRRIEFDKESFIASLPMSTQEKEEVAKKIVHLVLDDKVLAPAVKAVKAGLKWSIEMKTRQVMEASIETHANGKPGDLVLNSDVDEIPRRETLQMLKSCASNFPNELFPLGLEMESYLYSFEFRDSLATWRSAYAMRYHPDQHFPARDTQKYSLAKSGWHCSWCFAAHKDFVKKVESYSHSERNRPEYKTVAHVRKSVCSGQWMFNAWQEQKTFNHVVRSFMKVDPYDDRAANGVERHVSLHDVPKMLQLHPERLQYLVPGHCADRKWQ